MKPSNRQLLIDLLRHAPSDANLDPPRVYQNVRILEETRNAVLVEETNGNQRWLWRDEITIYREEDDRDAE